MADIEFQKPQVPVYFNVSGIKETNTDNIKEMIKISEGRIGTVLIRDEDDKLIALVSDGDIRRALLRDDFSLEADVLEYATLNPMTLEDEEMLASEALVLIEEKKIQLLVITDKNKKIKGVLHIHTLIEKGIS